MFYNLVRYMKIIGTTLIEPIGAGIFLIGFSWVLYGDVYISYATADILSGWDAMAHLKITEIYSETIFPWTFGWIPHFYAGMPFPTFYPPLFYFTISGLSLLTGFSIQQVFTSCIVGLLLTFPLILYRLSYKLTQQAFPSFVFGIAGVLFLGWSGFAGGSLGLTISATFQSGLITQLFGTWLLFVWLPSFLQRQSNTIIDYWPSMLGVFLIFLSNAHVVQTLFLMVLGVWLTDIIREKTFIKTTWFYIKYFGIPLILAGFWYLPLFIYYPYSTTMTLQNSLFGNYPLWIWVFVINLAVVAWTLSYKIKKFTLQRLGGSTLFLLIFFLPLTKIIPNLPIQGPRNLPILLLILSLLGIWGVYILFDDHIKWSISPFITPLLTLGVLSVFIINYDRPPDFLGNYPLVFTNEVRELQEHINPSLQGRSMVESFISQIPYRQNQREHQQPRHRIFAGKEPRPIPYEYALARQEYLPDHFIIAPILGTAHQQGLWTVFRESALSSIFIQPLRNSFSNTGEHFGTVCYLCRTFRKVALRDASVVTKLNRASLFNLRYFIAYSESQATWFDTYPEHFQSLYVSDAWNLYERSSTTSQYAEVLEHLPILVDTQIKTKDRPEFGPDAYDWLRLNEAWFLEGSLDPFFAYLPHELEVLENLNGFGGLMVIDYNYTDLNTATNQLLNITRDSKKTLLLFESEDPLYDRLITTNRSNIISFRPSHDIDVDIPEIMTILKERGVSTKQTNIGIHEVVLGNKKIRVTLDNPEQVLIPVFIKSSYFPAWKSENGAPIYLAGPNLSLVITDQEHIHLEFKDEYWKWYAILSFILIFLISLRYIYDRQFKVKG